MISGSTKDCDSPMRVEEDCRAMAFPGKRHGCCRNCPRGLQRGVVRQPLTRQSERLFQPPAPHGASERRLAHAILPVGDPGVVLLQSFSPPGRLPVGGRRVEKGQVPGIRERHLGACGNGAGSGFVFVKKWLFHERVIKGHGAPAASSSTSTVRTCSCRGSPSDLRGEKEGPLRTVSSTIGWSEVRRSATAKRQERRTVADYGQELAIEPRAENPVLDQSWSEEPGVIRQELGSEIALPALSEGYRSFLGARSFDEDECEGMEDDLRLSRNPALRGTSIDR